MKLHVETSLTSTNYTSEEDITENLSIPKGNQSEEETSEGESYHLVWEEMDKMKTLGFYSRYELPPMVIRISLDG